MSKDILTSTPHKFEDVSGVYSERFGFPPYYAAFIELLESHAGQVKSVLEIGGANGIVPERWNQVGAHSFDYRSVDPSKGMVEQASQKRGGLGFAFSPFVGTLDNVLESTGWSDQNVDLLIFSRSMHEIYLSVLRDFEILSQQLSTLIQRTRPQFIAYGDAEQTMELSPEKTQSFIQAQSDVIGHGHDPAVDYLHFSRMAETFQALGYSLQERRSVTQPLAGFDPSPWVFKMGLFKAL